MILISQKDRPSMPSSNPPTVHRRRFSGTWRSSDAGTPGSRSLSPTAGRKPPKSERSKVCCASSIFPLANRQYRWIVTSFIWLLPLQNPCIAEEEHGPVSHFPVANEPHWQQDFAQGKPLLLNAPQICCINARLRNSSRHL